MSSARIPNGKRDSILRDRLRVNKHKILASTVDWIVFVCHDVAQHNAQHGCIMKFVKVVVSGLPHIAQTVEESGHRLRYRRRCWLSLLTGRPRYTTGGRCIYTHT